MLFDLVLSISGCSSSSSPCTDPSIDTATTLPLQLFPSLFAGTLYAFNLLPFALSFHSTHPSIASLPAEFRICHRHPDQGRAINQIIANRLGSAAISRQMVDNGRLSSLLKAIGGESQIHLDENMSSRLERSVGEEGKILPESQSSHFNLEEGNSQEEEIKRLRTLLSDALLKEINLLCEKYRQEGQILELRSMIGKYQQDILRTNSQLTSILSEASEERARLRAEREAAQQDVDVYGSLLLPLLSEFDLQPASEDPHSIATGIKVLVRYLQDKRGTLVPQQYLIRDTPNTTRSIHDVHDHEMVRHQNQISRRTSASPNTVNSRAPVQHMTSRGPTYSTARFPKSEPHDFPGEDENRGTGNNFTPSSYMHEDPNSFVPNENDYLPDIKDLSIDGDPVIGNTICACGFPVNGTSLCIFQWVRHYPDGNHIYIPGALWPQYTINADDVGTWISLLCTPMDNRRRKGDALQLFVNSRNPITLERDIEEQILKYLNDGDVSFRVEMQDSNEVFSILAILTIKQFMYEIRDMHTEKRLAMRKYSSETKQVEIRIGNDCQFEVIDGIVHVLKCEDNRTRDLVVLIMRRFFATIYADKGKEAA